LPISRDCKQPAGAYVPVIDRSRCEGKAVCVKVCPTNVFAVGTLPHAERSKLRFPARVKGFMHGWQQALLVNPNACEGCGKCVAGCPEHAITLARTSAVSLP
jgi:4Fe-4S ferredoxin